MDTPVLLIELGGVIVGLAILSRLAGRFGFSSIPLFLVAGLAFGDGGILPLVTSEEFIEVGAEIGVILLLLTLGLQYSAEDLSENLRVGWPSGALNVLNAVPGLLAGWLLGWAPLEVALLGGITYVTSSGIAAKLVEDLRWVGNRETPVVLSLLVMEDLTMAAFLPVAAVLLRAGSGGAAAVEVLVAVSIVTVIFLVALRFGPILSRLVFSRSDEALLLSIFGLALAVAGVAGRLQVSAAVGAFLVGIALSGPAAERAQDLIRPLRDLFGAVFFAFFGLRVEPGSLPPVLTVALALAAAGVISKLATGWWAARRAGVGRAGRWRAGTLMVARGEFSIAIAALAVAAGVDGNLEALTASYVLVLAVLGPLLVRVVDALGHRRARRIARPASAGATMVPEAEA
jgi:monovalent cation:H+ antiporter-2, CPA2 family